MLARDVAGAARRDYDVVIIGGGVYGAMLALESTARGLRPLLVERGDFGGATSFNSFRLIHGGLRYLQSLDIVRLRESVAERRWFLRCFPELVAPAPCLMPLYRRGLRRRHVMRLALLANDLLSADRNSGLLAERRLPAGRILDRQQTLHACPGLRTHRLEGAALWWDAGMPDSQRLLMEVLRWAAAGGATALNYVQAERLLLAGGRACGVAARDRVTGDAHEFRARLVFNAAGPWVRGTAAELDRDYPSLFRPTLAWNVLLDRPPPSDTMLAVQAGDAAGHTYFVQPFKERLFLGTGHAEWHGGPDAVAPTPGQLAETLAGANEALPGLELQAADIVRVFAGLLPGRGASGMQLSDRPVILDHGRQGGPEGLYSISGVKFTTARRVAEAALHKAPGRHARRPGFTATRPPPLPRDIWNCPAASAAELETRLPGLRTLIGQEAVVHLDDLVLRRSTLWENYRRYPALAGRLCALFDWDATRRQRECDRLAAAFGPVIASAAAADALRDEASRAQPRDPMNLGRERT